MTSFKAAVGTPRQQSTYITKLFIVLNFSFLKMVLIEYQIIKSGTIVGEDANEGMEIFPKHIWFEF